MKVSSNKSKKTFPNKEAKHSKTQEPEPEIDDHIFSDPENNLSFDKNEYSEDEIENKENDKTISKEDEALLKKLNKKQAFILKQRERKEQMKMKRINKQLDEIKEIQARLDKESPPCGYYPKVTDDINETTPINLKPKIYFRELALSRKTIKGLNDDKKIKLTPIQRASIPHALYNRDILGASKTGSGKTLAFVIPILEKLFLNRWSSLDGLGALVIVPTRELAIQVFEVMKAVGKYHDFSLGLVIGGNKLSKEQSVLYNMNILVGTPGRLLQHMTETPYFSTENLQMLVVDEADRILDEGFDRDLTEIMKCLPKDKQTLMFSATLTKDIKALAKMSLKCPEHISINNIENLAMFNDEEITKGDKLSKINLNLKSGNVKEEASTETKAKTNPDQELLTPKNLHQFYNLVDLEKKLDVLYSFLYSHKNSKIVVFLSSCKQVRFFYESFRRMKLGFHFLELHGGQKQNKRTAIFYSFVEKTNCVLFATDLAARGIDFPSVHWVVQVDAPEDIQTYIHRVGRTARYKSQGSSLLFLTNSEKEYLKVFESKRIPVKPIKIKKDKVINLQPILRSILSENPDVMYLAQRAIVSYLKSIAHQSNKKIFDFNSIDVGKLSLSYGLMGKPNVVIKKKESKANEVEIEDDGSDDEKGKNLFYIYYFYIIIDTKKTKLEKFKEKIKKKKEEKKKQQDKAPLLEDDQEDKEDKKDKDDFLRLKRKHSEQSDNKTNFKNQNLEPKAKPILTKNAGYDSKVVTDRFKSIENELKLKEYETKEQDKERIKLKHKEDRIRAKAKDYAKHGLGGDDEEEEEEDEESENEEIVEDTNNRNNKINRSKFNAQEELAKKILLGGRRKNSGDIVEEKNNNGKRQRKLLF